MLSSKLLSSQSLRCCIKILTINERNGYLVSRVTQSWRCTAITNIVRKISSTVGSKQRPGILESVSSQSNRGVDEYIGTIHEIVSDIDVSPVNKANCPYLRTVTDMKTTPKDENLGKLMIEGESKNSESSLNGKSSTSEELIKQEPLVNIGFIPLPWHGRLGYACLNTVLRAYQEPIFCSRTCRLDTIKKYEQEGIDNNEGSGGGVRFLKRLGKRNAADLAPMIEWNERHGIKFMRISSEIFPFAAHEIWGYSLEHADEELQRAGKLCMKYGHRLTMHPGQFTQIASTNSEVFVRAEQDLEHHAEILDRLGLVGSSDRDAVMVIHLGGTYGDKNATIERFRKNYYQLSERVRERLVLENDDVSWTVRDILPLCEELNIPLVLDWHHHFVLHEDDMRPGNKDLEKYLPRIAATWSRKNKKQKQHYSESKFPGKISKMKLRAHSNRVYHLPPCNQTMDLMIEAKDKEQAVFELAKLYKIDTIAVPGTIEYDDRPLHESDAGYWPEGEEKRLARKLPRKSRQNLKSKELETETVVNVEQQLSTEEEISPTERKRTKKVFRKELKQKSDMSAETQIKSGRAVANSASKSASKKATEKLKRIHETKHGIPLLDGSSTQSSKKLRLRKINGTVRQ